MSTAQKDSPIYNKKVKKVLKQLEDGKSRKELANHYDYASWKSLDMYMRRKGFRYDSDRSNYVPDLPEQDNDPVPAGANSKVSLVISMFAKEGSDPREIAKKTGFTDHRELADYMDSRGYVWSSNSGNYVEKGETKSSQESNAGTVREDGEEVGGGTSDRKQSLPVAPAELLQYLPLLRKLKEKEEELDQLLSGKAEDGKVPKYAVPGDSMTKSTYMSRKLAQLVEQFSELKNVSQREIVEAALIEYLRKYGFAEETDALLRRS